MQKKADQQLPGKVEGLNRNRPEEFWGMGGGRHSKFDCDGYITRYVFQNSYNCDT
jgi:carotenoid cleavage dioxygenase-like enzyme